VYGELDLADALELDAAVAAGAQALKDLGSTDTLDVRRAAAVGDLARRQLTLDLNPVATTPDSGQATDDDQSPTEATGTSRRATRKPRQVVLYVHLADAAVVPDTNLVGEFGRVENTRGPVHAEQIRQWCGHPDAQVTVNPVLDLNDHIDVESYEIRGRLREQTLLAHPTCVFPWCTRPARALEPDEHDADCDHRIPYAIAGHSCSCNTAPLCRRHHRAKTHGRWSYTALERGSYVWTSPHGYQFLRDQHGTLDVSRDRHPHPADPCTHRSDPCTHPPDD